MRNVTVNVSFVDSLLDNIDQEARRQSRSRSELIREAARLYLRRQRRWDDLFRLGDRQAAKLRLTEEDVGREVAQVRKRKQK